MLASIIIGFVGYALSLLFAALFACGLAGLVVSVIDEAFAIAQARMTSALLFGCGPAAIAAAALTRFLI